MKALYSRDEFRGDDADPPPTWHRAERFVREEYDLVEDHSSWHDARTEDGEPIEIKSCAYEYADGRLGRFKIFDRQWSQLLATGRVILLLYIPTPPYKVLATHAVEPGAFNDRGTVIWRHKYGSPSRRLRCVPWPELIPIDAIEFGCRGHFVDKYPDREVEETVISYRPDGWWN
jgi:hypothetical protein